MCSLQNYWFFYYPDLNKTSFAAVTLEVLSNIHTNDDETLFAEPCSHT